MKKIKNLLFGLLGRERYLSLVAQVFFLAFRSGWLRSNPEYSFHYFVRRLIRPGDHILDIGANLGYYSVNFAALTGPSGWLWSVEPVPLYRNILARNLSSFANAEIVPYALGEEPGTVRMGIPGDQPFRHGLTRVLNAGESAPGAGDFEVEIRRPDAVFQALDRLDYIKCDVEGYEIHILPQMLFLIRRFRPLVQVEVAALNRSAIFDLFLGEHYRAFALDGERLRLLEGPADPSSGDLLFVPEEKRERISDWINGQE